MYCAVRKAVGVIVRICCVSVQYLASVRQLPGYGEVVFPHCPCDSRKGGHVIVTAGTDNFSLHACSEEGVSEVSSARHTTAPQLSCPCCTPTADPCGTPVAPLLHPYYCCGTPTSS